MPKQSENINPKQKIDDIEVRQVFNTHDLTKVTSDLTKVKAKLGTVKDEVSVTKVACTTTLEMIRHNLKFSVVTGNRVKRATER